MDCEELKNDMDAILAAWTDLCNATNHPDAKEEEIEAAYKLFDETMMPLMVAQGHPGSPFPRRRP
jgi:hypothetical protein